MIKMIDARVYYECTNARLFDINEHIKDEVPSSSYLAKEFIVMSEITTNNRSLYISAANLVSNIIGQKPHNPNIVWNIQLLKESN